jgi:peptide/nickel transport system permease protein
MMRRLARSPQGAVGGALLLLVVLIAIGAPLLAPFDPFALDLPGRLLPPLARSAATGARHLLGTDAVGRDILSRVIYGSRVSLSVGLAAVFVGAAFGSLIGCLSGYFGGAVEATASWLIDVQLSFPFLLLAIFLLATFGGGTGVIVLILALGTWVNYARIVRGQVLSIKNQDYVEAAHAAGVGPARLLMVHILPNTLSPVIVVAGFSMAQAILTEAGLSFLGVGIDPSIPSWGTMLNDGRDYLQSAWWISTVPGIAIGITVLGINLFGDYLRDALDPRGTR